MSAEESHQHDSSTCSACGAYLKLNEIVCIECGLNQRTSYKIASAQKSRSGLNPMMRMALGIGLAIVAMNVITLNRDLRGYAQEAADTEDLFAPIESSEEPVTRTAPPPPPTATASSNPIPSTTSRVTPSTTSRVPRNTDPTPEPGAPAIEPDPEPDPEPVPEPEFGMAPPSATPTTIPEPPAVTPEPEPEPEPIDITVLKQQIQTEITEDMKHTLPMMTTGRIQTLETNAGTKSGMVNLIGPDYLLITVRGTPTRISFTDLETKSRIRVDATFRAKMIEDMTYRKLAKSQTKSE
jgi:hypothetical protein